MTKHYSNNLVYVISIDNESFYVGIHSVNQKYLTENGILSTSSNPIRLKVLSKEITYDEYHSRCFVCRIEECKTREEAITLYKKLLEEYEQEGYFSPGHFGKKQIKISKEKLRQSHIGIKQTKLSKELSRESNKGNKQTKETKDKMSKLREGKKLSEETKKIISIKAKELLSKESKLYHQMKDNGEWLGTWQEFLGRDL